MNPIKHIDINDIYLKVEIYGGSHNLILMVDNSITMKFYFFKRKKLDMDETLVSFLLNINSKGQHVKKICLDNSWYNKLLHKKCDRSNISIRF